MAGYPANETEFQKRPDLYQWFDMTVSTNWELDASLFISVSDDGCSVVKDSKKDYPLQVESKEECLKKNFKSR